MAEISFFDRVATHRTHVPDVLSCIANLSNDEVFTPPDVVNKMLDLLPQDLFADPKTTFLDPATKTGVFLREIAKRCLDAQLPGYKERSTEIGDKKKLGIPLDEYDLAFEQQLQERIDHIFHNQLFGIGITELTSLLARRSVYCSKWPNGPYSITHFDDAEGNILFRRTEHTWRKGKCVFCGANQEQYDRGEILETHAYEFIHTVKPEEIFKMQFDVIIGNPPYQLNTVSGETTNVSKQAKPIYNLFVQQAKKLNPRFLCMIIPSRWFAGGLGLDAFRQEMIEDSHITHLVDYNNAKDCFPQNSISGGVCYFLRERDNSGPCKFTNISNQTANTATRSLSEFPVVVRYNRAVDIIRKVCENTDVFLKDIVSPISPFAIPTKTTGVPHCTPLSNLTLYTSKGVGYITRKEVLSNTKYIDKYKVMVSQIGAEHAGEPGRDGMFRVLTSSMRVMTPNEVCTNSYIVIGEYSEPVQPTNLLAYLKTRFARFLVLQAVSSIHISRTSFTFVPLLDFSKPWTDEELYEKYNLTEEEISFIESMIKPMDLGGDE